MCVLFLLEKKGINTLKPSTAATFVRDDFYRFLKAGERRYGCAASPPAEDLGIVLVDHLTRSVNQGHNLSS